MPRSVIVGGSRTPIGKLGGALSTFSAVELGGIAIREALAATGVSGADVDYVIMGHVIQAGAGQITARQAAVKAGIPMTVPALTVNKVCLSGLNAIAMAARSPPDQPPRSPTAPPPPGLRCTSLSSSGGAAAASARPACVAADRARHSFFASQPDSRSLTREFRWQT